jgi:hypothetical protein
MQISGALAGPIPIQSAIGARGQRISVLAYADDITVFPLKREDIEKVHHAIRIYERATGAQLNPIKSRVLAVWGWSEPITHLGIELFQHVTILGVTFGSTVDATVQEIWAKVTNGVRAHTNSLRPQLVPRSPGTIFTNLPLSENMVPCTGLTTDDPLHPAADVDLHVVYMERCHLSCSHNDPQEAEISRWMGSTRHNSKMSGAPQENVDIRRTDVFRDSCLLTNVEPNRCSGKPPKCRQNPEQTRLCPPIYSGHGICIATSYD